MNTAEKVAMLYAVTLSRGRKQQRQDWISYSEAAEVIGLNMENPQDRNEIAELLGYISKAEVAQGRPMLSSVVVHKDGSGPGQGFFNLARELGRAKPTEEDYVVHAREMKKTHETWNRSGD